MKELKAPRWLRGTTRSMQELSCCRWPLMLFWWPMMLSLQAAGFIAKQYAQCRMHAHRSEENKGAQHTDMTSRDDASLRMAATRSLREPSRYRWTLLMF
jgi:hypothetical protein